MRKIACLAPIIVVAACAAAPAASDGPAAPAARAPASDGTCSAAGSERFVGQTRSDQTSAAILAATGAGQIRWVTPGMMVTMDFLPTRVTVHVGADGRITRIACG